MTTPVEHYVASRDAFVQAFAEQTGLKCVQVVSGGRNPPWVNLGDRILAVRVHPEGGFVATLEGSPLHGTTRRDVMLYLL